MPGTTAPPEIELIIEDIGGGRGNPPPAGGDDGDNGGENDNRHRKQSPSPKRYSTAITIALVSILMFFMALASAFIVLRRGGGSLSLAHPVSESCGCSPPAWEFYLLPDSWLRGGNWSRKACTSRATRPAVFFIFSPERTLFTCWAAWAHYSTFLFANSIRKEFRSALPRESLPTTGISWMDFGFFCWRCSTWENNSKQRRKNLTFQKIGDGLDAARDLFFAQFRIHRQRKHFLRGALGVREVARLVAERCVERLQMQWIRIVDGAADFSLAQKMLKGIAAFDSNGVLVEDVFESFRHDGRHHARNLIQ